MDGIVRVRTIAFTPDRMPMLRRIRLGYEGDNLVERLEFDLPEITVGQTATLMITGVADAVKLAQTDEGRYAVDLTRDMIGLDGEREAYVRIDGAGEKVWQSAPMRMTTGALPDVEEEIEKQYPTAVGQMLTAMAEHSGEMAAQEERVEQAAQRAEEAAERAEAGGGGGGGSGITVEIDATLTQAGKAADAKATGDRLSELSEEMAKKEKPLVYIDGVIPTTKDNVLATMAIESDWLNIFAYIKIKCQGSSSMDYPKKNFTVTLYQDEARTIPMYITIPGWKHPSNKFVLKANYIDHLHARNIVSARLWSEIVSSRPDYNTLPEELRNSPNNGAVDGFPIIVYANGNYQGIYTWNIGKDAWMWGMDEDNPNHVLLCAEINTDGTFRETPCNFRSLWGGTDGSYWSVEVGENSDAVKNALNALISCVKDTTDEEFVAQIGTCLDVQSAIDYYIFSYYDCALDNLGKNMLLGTYDMRKFILGRYDNDSTWGLYWNGSKFVPATYACPDDYQEAFSLLFERIVGLFKSRVMKRAAELRNTVLSYKNVLSHFERFCAEIGTEAYNDDTTAYPNIPLGETNNIWQIRNFVKDRFAYVDSCINAWDHEVPEEYQQIEYVKTDGTQYFDTGISGGINAAYEISMNTLGARAVGYEQYFRGARGKSSAPGLFRHDGLTVPGVVIMSSDASYLNLFPLSNADDHIIAYADDGTVMLDGETVGTLDCAGVGWGSTTFYLASSHDEPNLMASMRLYYLKMWTDKILVRHFVPVIRKSDNVAGLYDHVTKSFFVNLGEGQLVTPDDDATNDIALYPLKNGTSSSGESSLQITNGNHVSIVNDGYEAYINLSRCIIGAKAAAFVYEDKLFEIKAGDIVTAELKNITVFESGATCRGSVAFVTPGDVESKLGADIDFLTVGTNTTLQNTMSADLDAGGLIMWSGNMDVNAISKFEFDLYVYVNGVRYI